MRCSGRGAACIRKNHHMYFVANSWLVCRYIVNVGAMSMRQTFLTLLGKSRHSRWATRIPVSSQIRHVDRELLGESRRNFVPGNVALGISMQKENRWSVAFVKNRDGRFTGANLSLHKAGKELRRNILRRFRWQFGQGYGFHRDRLRCSSLAGDGGRSTREPVLCCCGDAG